MNFSDSCSSSSSKRQENGDMFTETKRPYKKARFSWQVKGKNNLKNKSSDDINDSSTSSATDISSIEPNIVIDTHNTTKNAESNIEILGDYLLKNDCNNIDTVINDSEKSVFKPCNNVNKEANEYPRYIASYENGINVPNNLSNLGACSSTSRITNAMVNQSLILTEDICITRWQARQKARVFADNTINRVLEITNRPWNEPVQTDLSRNITQDFAEFINNLPGANTVEDEGILMAISAHGLQNTSSPNIRRRVEDIEEKYINSNLPSRELMQSSSSSNSEMFETARNIEKYFEKQEMDESEQSSTSNENNKSKFTAEDSPVRCNSSMSNDFFDDILDDTCSGESFYPYCEIDENITMQTDHYDFMNEAVSFAIQNIGLTSSSTNCG